MTRQEASRLVAVMLASYPSQAVKIDADRAGAMVDAFVSVLGDLSYEEGNAALLVLMQTRSWMPALADVRSAVLELKRGPQRKGGEAWGSVLAAMKREGAYRAPGLDFYFLDPVTARCVEALGWRDLCLSESSVADRARFIDLYDQLANDEQRTAQSPALATARANRALGIADLLLLRDQADE